MFEALCVGIQGNALKWFQSYFDNVSVSIGEFTAGAASLTRDVPQDLFSLYMLHLGSIFKKHSISFQLC